MSAPWRRARRRDARCDLLRGLDGRLDRPKPARLASFASPSSASRQTTDLWRHSRHGGSPRARGHGRLTTSSRAHRRVLGERRVTFITLSAPRAQHCCHEAVPVPVRRPEAPADARAAARAVACVAAASLLPRGDGLGDGRTCVWSRERRPRVPGGCAGAEATARSAAERAPQRTAREHAARLQGRRRAATRSRGPRNRQGPIRQGGAPCGARQGAVVPRRRAARGATIGSAPARTAKL